KRQTFISRAVTKGLNPDAETKDSGSEWLGEIPSHWEVKRMKYISNIISGQSPNELTYNTVGIGVVLINGPAEYSEEDFGFTRAIKWTTEPKQFAPKNALLFCLRGSTTGRLNIAHDTVAIGRGVAAIISKQNQKYLNYQMMALRSYVLGTSGG